jgi:hypothetical protein
MFGLIISASLLAAPQPIRLDTWFSSNDYPTSEMDRADTTFRTVTQTLVDANGRIIGCRAETASSDPEIDALSCAIILKRGKFEPARWSDGAVVPGIYRKAISFLMFGDDRNPIGDIELEVARLPDGQKSPTFVTVAFASDANGHIVDCGDQPSLAKHSKPANPALLRLACQSVVAEWKPFTVLGPDGKPSRSVQDATVLFTVAGKTKP